MAKGSRLESEFRVESVSDRCANDRCDNNPGGGMFAKVTIGHVELFVCRPCAEEIERVFRKDNRA